MGYRLLRAYLVFIFISVGAVGCGAEGDGTQQLAQQPAADSSDGTDTNQCADVDCGTHATCVEGACSNHGLWSEPASIEEDNPAGLASWPTIAMNGSGQGIAAWVAADAVWVSRFDGTKWMTPRTLSVGGVGGHIWVGIDSAGKAVLIMNTGNLSLVRFDGIKWGDVEELANSEVTSRWSAAMNGKGQIMLYRYYNDCKARFFDGSTWSSDVTITAAWPDSVRIALGDDGAAIAVWDEKIKNSDGSDKGSVIYANRFDGKAWNTPEKIVNEEGQAFYPEVAIGPGGAAMAVWHQSVTHYADIWANRFDGTKWGVAEKIETKNEGDALRPAIVFAPNGEATAVWHQSDGKVASIWANRFDGIAWGKAQEIEKTNTGDAMHPDLTADSSGKVNVIWVQYDDPYNWDTTCECNFSQVWTNRFDGDSWGHAKPIGPDKKVEVYFSQIPDKSKSIAGDSNGNSITVWWQDSGLMGGIGRVFASRFESLVEAP